MTQAFARMQHYSDHRSNEVQKLKLQRGEHLSAESTELLTTLVTMNDAAMKQTRKALLLPESRYPVDFSPGPMTLMPHCKEAKAMAQLFRYKARLASDSGQTQVALESIMSLLEVGRTLEAEPQLISQLVRISIVTMAAGEFENFLSYNQASESDLIKLSAGIRRNDTNRMALALIGDRALYLPCFRMGQKEFAQVIQQSETNDNESAPGSINGSALGLMRASGFFERDLSYYLDSMETNIALARLAPPHNLQLTNVSEMQGIKAKSRYCIFSSMFLPALAKVTVKESQLIARVRLVEAAAAVERYRLAHKRLPTNLEALVAEFFSAVPEDPFDGQPMRYKLLPKGYMIYSIGQDGIDDGGKEQILAQQKRGTRPKRGSVPETYDITFMVDR